MKRVSLLVAIAIIGSNGLSLRHATAGDDARLASPNDFLNRALVGL
jgi:hypothetical protein